MTARTRTSHARGAVRAGVAVAGLICCSIPAADLRAQTTLPGTQHEPVWTRPSGTRVELLPAGDVYPVYVADPHRATNAIELGVHAARDIPETRSPRARLSAGGRFGMLRISSGRPGGRSLQVSIEAGLDALFDSQNKADAVGWDGHYGLAVTTASGSRLALKIAVLHVSAHLGDEYQHRANLERINYTREELSLGAAWRFSPRWRAYGETGVAYHQGSSQQQPWRLQWGLEHASRPRLWGGRFARYAAADFSTMEERDWRLDTTIQGGIVTRSNGREARLFLQLHDGRPSIGEFYRFSETVVTLGFRIDL